MRTHGNGKSLGFGGLLLSLFAVMGAISPTVADPFGDVTQRIEPIPPIEPPPPPEDIDEKAPPPPRQPVPQRVHVLDSQSFMILPEDTPLPHGTISGKTLDGEEEVSPALQPVPLPRRPSLQAKMFEAVGGKTYLRLAGFSYGRPLNLQHVASLPPDVQEEEVDVSSPPPPEEPQAIEEKAVTAATEPQAPARKPQPALVQQHKAGFRYVVDDVKPREPEKELQKLVKEVTGKTIRRVYVTARSSRVPLVEPVQLPLERWAYLQQQLAAAGVQLSDVSTSFLYLTESQNQGLEVELVIQE
jgi:hypothetical protein